MSDPTSPTDLSALKVYVSSPVPSGSVDAEHILTVHGIVSNIKAHLTRAGYIAELNRVIPCPDEGCYEVPTVKVGGLTFPSNACPVTTLCNELTLLSEALENPIQWVDKQHANKQLASSDISSSLQTAKRLRGTTKHATAMAVVVADSTTTMGLRRATKAEYVEANSRLKPTTPGFVQTTATVAAVVHGCVILENGLPAYSRWPDVLQRLQPGVSKDVMARETKRTGKVLEIYQIVEEEQAQGELYQAEDDDDTAK